MSDFSALEQAFFQAGEQLSEIPERYVATERRPKSWLGRLLATPGWSPLPLLESTAADPFPYASYELVAALEEDEYVSYEMAA